MKLEQGKEKIYGKWENEFFFRHFEEMPLGCSSGDGRECNGHEEIKFNK